MYHGVRPTPVENLWFKIASHPLPSVSACIFNIHSLNSVNLKSSFLLFWSMVLQEAISFAVCCQIYKSSPISLGLQYFMWIPEGKGHTGVEAYSMYNLHHVHAVTCECDSSWKGLCCTRLFCSTCLPAQPARLNLPNTQNFVCATLSCRKWHTEYWAKSLVARLVAMIYDNGKAGLGVWVGMGGVEKWNFEPHSIKKGMCVYEWET